MSDTKIEITEKELIAAHKLYCYMKGKMTFKPRSITRIHDHTICIIGLNNDDMFGMSFKEEDFIKMVKEWVKKDNIDLGDNK